MSQEDFTQKRRVLIPPHSACFSPALGAVHHGGVLLALLAEDVPLRALEDPRGRRQQHQAHRAAEPLLVAVALAAATTRR